MAANKETARQTATVNKETARQFKVGDIVRYAPNWCSEGERRYLHIVKEDRTNSLGERYLIKTINSNMVFAPTETVEAVMIEQTGLSIEDLLESK